MRYVLAVVKESHLLFLIPLLLGLSVLCARLGVDAAVYRFAQLQSENLSAAWSEVPLHAGSVAPVLVPLFMFFLDKVRAVLTLRSIIFTVLIVTILKAFTSRVDPEGIHIIDVFERSNAFEIGLLKNGLISVVEGWPSGHAAANVAMVSTVVFAFGARIRIAGSLWALWVVLATVLGDRGGVHWLSDSLSGTAIGAAIGFAHLSIHENRKMNIYTAVGARNFPWKRSDTSPSSERGNR